MNKLIKFYIYIGILQLVSIECHGMYCYKQYKYRKWHPLVWLMLLIGAVIQMAGALTEMWQDLKNGALDEVVEIPFKNTIKKNNGE